MTNAANITRTLTLSALGAAALTVSTGIATPSTAHASSPEACVQQVMTGGVNWGGGTSWQRQNAVALCKGAKDYNARIVCFTGMVGGGTHWSQAIKSCQAIGGGSPTAGHKVNGRTVGMVRFAGGTFEQRGNGWVETGSSGQERFRFEETNRDEWSVYLYDRSRNVSLQLDLHRDMILYEGSPLYPITSVAKAKGGYGHEKPKPKTYTVEAGPIWNQADANGKCRDLAYQQQAEWTGQWWTTVQGKMSVCQLKR